MKSRPALSFFPYGSEVKIIRRGKPDRFGAATEIADDEVYKCHIQLNTENETFLDYRGEQTVFTAKLLFPYPVEVKVDDKIVFTDDWGKEQKKKVLAVQVKRDFGRNLIAVKAVI